MVRIAQEEFRLLRGRLANELVGCAAAQGLETAPKIVSMDKLLQQSGDICSAGERDAVLDYPPHAGAPAAGPGMRAARQLVLDPVCAAGLRERAFSVARDKGFSVKSEYPADAEGKPRRQCGKESGRIGRSPTSSHPHEDEL